MATPAPTPPGSPPALPVSTDAESTFDTLWDAFNAWLKNNLWPYLGAVAYSTAANATEAEAAAATATAQASAAVAARDTAFAAANFKGNWGDLTGALAMPACVRHSGRFWVLLASLGDVTTAAPGVSASWAALDAGTVPSQLLSTAGATVNAVVGVRYLVAANNVTVNIPTGLLKGDFHGVRWMSGFSGGVWAFGAVPLRRMAVGSLTVDTPLFGLDVFYEDATEGLI